jgi:hypothetical protein
MQRGPRLRIGTDACLNRGIPKTDGADSSVVARCRKSSEVGVCHPPINARVPIHIPDDETPVRFHPAEKTLQFLLDTLPFMLVGIGTEVLAYYFVFYSMSGLFQHSNCDVRLGWLNYLVSGPEVHRWHHSQKTAESNANYAHSFVVWDLLFDTYFRPRGAEVTRLGLLVRDYPRRFVGQLLAPFRSYSDGANDPV